MEGFASGRRCTCLRMQRSGHVTQPPGRHDRMRAGIARESTRLERRTSLINTSAYASSRSHPSTPSHGIMLASRIRSNAVVYPLTVSIVSAKPTSRAALKSYCRSKSNTVMTKYRKGQEKFSMMPSFRPCFLARLCQMEAFRWTNSSTEYGVGPGGAPSRPKKAQMPGHFCCPGKRSALKRAAQWTTVVRDRRTHKSPPLHQHS